MASSVASSSEKTLITGLLDDEEVASFSRREAVEEGRSDAAGREEGCLVEDSFVDWVVL